MKAEAFLRLVEKDPVTRFCQKVHEQAATDPLWDANYPMAFYAAFIAEYMVHLRANFPEEIEVDLIDPLAIAAIIIPLK